MHWAIYLKSAGLLHEAKGLQKEALKSFEKALDIDPNHIPSLISTAIILRRLSQQSVAVAKSFLTDALRLDRSNHVAWYNLGLIYKSEGSACAHQAVECFEAAALLQESEPIEPFRSWSGTFVNRLEAEGASSWDMVIYLDEVNFC